MASTLYDMKACEGTINYTYKIIITNFSYLKHIPALHNIELLSASVSKKVGIGTWHWSGGERGEGVKVGVEYSTFSTKQSSDLIESYPWRFPPEVGAE